MNHPKTRSVRQAGFSLLAAMAISLQARAQQTDTQPADATPVADEHVVKLSPFKVTTDKDKGYRATNTTGGTRLNAEIKDLPMPIEVITEQFIKDIGARDLRQSLAYSGGIQLLTQTDWGAQQPYGNPAIPGQINATEGLTATSDQTHVKIRGFPTDSALRDGFRRQNSTDSINISRVEVIRGPSTLLYGVGNFGGVVNYLVKMPETKAGGNIGAEIGSYGLKRGTLEYTGPISSTVSYRLSAAIQGQNDYTQYKKENHFFVSPVIVWKPFENTEVLFDTEYGKQNRAGIGFMNLRAISNQYVGAPEGYDAAFLELKGINPKTFRWSGPDTFNNSEAYNFEVKLTQKLGDNLNLSTGYNSSSVRFDQRDVVASIQTANPNTPNWAKATILAHPLIPGQQGISTQPFDATIGYQWASVLEVNKHNQVRTDLTYNLKLFESSNWFKMDNTILVGQNYTHELHTSGVIGTAFDRNNSKSPNDYTPFRYGFQGNGAQDYRMVEQSFTKNTTQDAASYAVYMGKLLDERVTLIAGIRKDRSWNKNNRYAPGWSDDGLSHFQGNPPKPEQLHWVATYADPSKDTTHQYGVDIRLTKDGSLSVFAMSAEASQPNYNGALDFNEKPLKASLGKDKEIGLKFDLFHGRLSGTISKFKIDRTRVGVGDPGQPWWAPVSVANLNYNPNKDIVYQAQDVSPQGNAYSWFSTTQAVRPQWDAGVAAGAIYQATNSKGEKNWYVNASKAAGAAYLDALFAQGIKDKAKWFGWLWESDNITNNTSKDQQANHIYKSQPLGSDRSTGWDGQIMFSPTDNLQIYASWSHTTKVVVHASQWIKYPYGYDKDRWAIWYAPVGYQTPPGKPATAGFLDPNDTSTNIAFGDGLPLDDTPKNTGSIWIHYEFPKTSGLHGLHLGVGAQYQGSGALYPIFSRQQYDASGNPVTLNTEPKTDYNGMVRYEFKVKGHEASLQLNIDNLTNNTKYFGFVANAPRKLSLTYVQKL